MCIQQILIFRIDAGCPRLISIYRDSLHLLTLKFDNHLNERPSTLQY